MTGRLRRRSTSCAGVRGVVRAIIASVASERTHYANKALRQQRLFCTVEHKNIRRRKERGGQVGKRERERERESERE